jgi:hypothetical protein
MAFAPLFLSRARHSFNKIIAGQMGVFVGTERRCTEDEHENKLMYRTISTLIGSFLLASFALTEPLPNSIAEDPTIRGKEELANAWTTPLRFPRS